MSSEAYSILLTLIFKIGILTPSKYIHSAQSDNAKKNKMFVFLKKSPSKILKLCCLCCNDACLHVVITIYRQQCSVPPHWVNKLKGKLSFSAIVRPLSTSSSLGHGSSKRVCNKNE